MDSPIGEEEDSSLGDFIEDENMLSPSDSADYQMLKKELMNALDTLTDRERKVIELRFGHQFPVCIWEHESRNSLLRF